MPFLDHHVVELCARDAGRPEGAPARDEARPPARRARARPRPDHRQAEDRLLQRRRRRLVPRADARRDQRLPARPESALRGDDRPRRGRAARQGPRRRERRGQRLRAALDPDARGLALGVPAARARRRRRRARENRRPDDAHVRRHHAGSGRSGEPAPARREPGGADRAAAALARSSTTAPTDGTLELAARARAEHDWVRVLSVPGAAAAERGAPIVRALHAAIDELARRPARLRRQRRRRHLDGAGLLRAAARRASTRTRRSGSRAAAPSSSRTATGGSGTSPARRSGARRAPSGGTACRRSSRSRSGSPGTASTSSRRTPAAGARRPSRTCPSGTTAARASATGRTWRARRNQGHAAYYVGYRPWYLVLRSLWNARREPAALGMICGLRGGRRAPGAAERRRGRPRLPPSPAERAEPAAPLARGDRTPRPRGLRSTSVIPRVVADRAPTMTSVSRVLLIARHFPPLGGAGVHRSVGTARHLGSFGYSPVVVTGPGAPRDRWDSHDADLLRRIPADRGDPSSPRTRAVGTYRHRGSRRAVFDRVSHDWVRWWIDEATALGRRVGAGAEVVLTSCAPYETAWAGARVAVDLGTPWVADLEDPWALDEMRVYPTAVHRALALREMRRALELASAIVMAAPEAAARVRRAMPELAGAGARASRSASSPTTSTAPSGSRGRTASSGSSTRDRCTPTSGFTCGEVDRVGACSVA